MIDRQAIQVPGLKTIGPYSQAVRAAVLDSDPPDAESPAK